MNAIFNPTQGLVLVRGEIVGPNGRHQGYFAMDTGATHTLVDSDWLVTAGYPDAALERRDVTMGAGVESAARIEIERLTVLGEERRAFHVLCHSLPKEARIDGLLGLDWLRGHRLTLDFRTGLLMFD